MKKYRIVEITHKNAMITWAIQKQKRHWLTGKEYWVYYREHFDYYYDWTRNISDAYVFQSIEQAEHKLKTFQSADGWKAVNLKTVKEMSL